ncbi:MAG TPA: deoxyribodipyrimidine photo-lyase [Solirubrobacterales bacterium]
MTSIVWLRRDLRLHDHPALRAALADGERVVPFFCFDDRLLHGRHSSGPRTRFMLESLRELDRALRERGSGLVVRHGPPERELASLAAEVAAGAVHFTADVSPFARARGRRVAAALRGSGVELHAHPGLTVADDASAIVTKAGKPYRVFTPYYNAWAASPRRELLGPPRSLPPLSSRLAKGRLPSAEALGLLEHVREPSPGGEAEGRRRLAAFLRDGVAEYASTHDALGEDRTSRLSAYLRFGCVSPREIEARLPGGAGAAEFRRQLCWRDFYHQLLHHHPRNARSEMQDRYRGRLRWSRSRRSFDAWCDGRTGFPLVDAAMRQLRREGFIHNRARLVAGSFLTKDLGIDWRWGERWFMRWLIDGDEANNNGNWQWIASVGADPAPVFRRIYNPARHAERYDPEGAYVRRYVPELRDVPAEHLGEPWRMPDALQRECGCVIGADYPEPIVDHAEARREALDRYRA